MNYRMVIWACIREKMVRRIELVPRDCCGWRLSVSSSSLRSSSNWSSPPPSSTTNSFVAQACDIRWAGSPRSFSAESSSAESDHYETLGVARDATQQHIKQSFYELSKQCHPDLHPGDDRMAEKFKSLATAYEVLMDETARSAYDFALNGKSTSQRWHGHTGSVAKPPKAQVSYVTHNQRLRREKPHSGGRSHEEGDEEATRGDGTPDRRRMLEEPESAKWPQWTALALGRWILVGSIGGYWFWFMLNREKKVDPKKLQELWIERAAERAWENIQRERQEAAAAEAAAVEEKNRLGIDDKESPSKQQQQQQQQRR